jgi:hypothetical protein
MGKGKARHMAGFDLVEARGIKNQPHINVTNGGRSFYLKVGIISIEALYKATVPYIQQFRYSINPL